MANEHLLSSESLTRNIAEAKNLRRQRLLIFCKYICDNGIYPGVEGMQGFGERMGRSTSWMRQYTGESVPTKKFLNELKFYYPMLNIDWFFSGNGEMLDQQYMETLNIKTESDNGKDAMIMSLKEQLKRLTDEVAFLRKQNEMLMEKVLNI